MSIPKLEPGARFAGEFQVVRPFAEGGLADAYVVDQDGSPVQRVLQLLPLANESAFEQEARVGAGIESDHVVQVASAGVDASGVPWIAMELLRGEDLASRVASSGPVALATTREILGQLSHALGAAHDVSLVHQGLKPERLFLAVPRRDGVPFMLKVLDFGIAKLLDDAAKASSLASGAPLWMAPEQIDAKGSVTPSVDIWALGLIAYYALTGRSFWRATASDSPSALVREIAFEPLPAASERASETGVASLLPLGFDAWFARCVARDPSQRFATVREARVAFDALGDAQAEPLPRAPVESPPVAPFGAAPVAPPQPHQVFGPPPAPGWGRLPPVAPRSGPSTALLLALSAVVLLPVFAGVAGFAVYRVSARKKAAVAVQKAQESWSDEDSPVPVSYRDPIWGDRDAPVTLVEFSDFQCPFCARVEPTLSQLRDKYGPQKLRIVWKNQPLPFHTNAAPAAEAAQVVFERNGKVAFWDFHHLAFQNQKTLGREAYVGWASSLGLDGPSYATALDSRKGRSKVDEDKALAARIGATGTPSFFINGVSLAGAQPVDKFEKLIDAELEKADAKVASGTRKDRVYVELSKASFGTKAPTPTPTTARELDDGAIVRNVPVGASPVRGLATAPVTIVVFADYQCPFCKKSEATLKSLRDLYGDKIRIVWKDLPLAFHGRAIPAAELALEARKQRGDKGFWTVHDLLMQSTTLEDSDLRRIAGQADLDVTKAMAAVSERAHSAERAEDDRLVKKLGVTGTPQFFVNGRSLRGAQPIESFKAVVDAELVHAAKLVASGVTSARVYETILKTAVEPSGKADGSPTDGRLVIDDLVVGKGTTANAGDKVSVHYVGTLKDGKEFDSSRKRELPFTFDLGAGHVIKGWDQGIVGMRVGGQRKLTIPPSLAYGESGHPPIIPASATLVFVVELLEVKAK